VKPLGKPGRGKFSWPTSSAHLGRKNFFANAISLSRDLLLKQFFFYLPQKFFRDFCEIAKLKSAFQEGFRGKNRWNGSTTVSREKN
jgi:hypothetical protein